MFHDSPDHCIKAVGNRIHINLCGIIEKPVDQYWFSWRDFHCILHIIFQVFPVIHYFHGTAAQDKGWPYNYRVSNFISHADGLFLIACDSVFRLQNAQFLKKALETFPVLSPVYTVRTGSKNSYPCLCQGNREIQGCLTAKLDNDPFGFFLFDNIKYILPGQGLEIEFVGCIIVSADSLRVTVDHDTLYAHLFQGK